MEYPITIEADMTIFGHEFEEEVRQLARCIWNLPSGGGASDFINGEEIDCICRTEDVIHLVECTTEKKLAKIQDDTKSLLKVKQYLERAGNTVRPWIITFHEPTPDQQAYARANKVTVLSVAQFRTRILRAADYLNARWNYKFGSASDPGTGSHALGEEAYVPLPLTALKTGEAHTVSTIIDLLVGERRAVVLLGPFGAGKSVTVREVFKSLRARYFKDSQQPIPVAINLRDHWGQEDTDEVLRRHAAKVGFAGRDELVRAWNAHLLILLLDGFDELASQGWRVAPANMRQTRREAVRIIRAFMRENEGGFGILIAGRDHYFDTDGEMVSALTLPQSAVRIELGEFNDDQAHKYLKTRGIDEQLPDWLPRKPLLLGYLAAKGLLKDILSIDGTRGAAHAWNVFLDKVCSREAALSKDIEGPSVRRLLELLASKTRQTLAGAGPLIEADLSNAYLRTTGVEPLEEARTLLQRLPGLTARDQQEGGRSFVDAEMLDALRGSFVARFIREPFTNPESENWKHPLGELGCSVSALLTTQLGVKLPSHSVAAQEAYTRWTSPTLALDCLISAAHRMEGDSFDCGGLVLKEGFAETLDFEHAAICNIQLQWCEINTLIIGETTPNAVTLYECIVHRLVGVADERGLPKWIVGGVIGEYDDLHTNAAIMRSTAPVPVKVLLTILRKLFMQRGRARRESSFHRGLDAGSGQYVGDVLRILRKESIAHPFAAGEGTIWHPNRRHQGRVMRVVSSLGVSDDPLVQQVSELR